MDANVCARHVEDAYLKVELSEAAEEDVPCTFCDDAPPGVDLDYLRDLVAYALHRQFQRADDAGVSFEDGDYVGAVLGTEDALLELFLDAGIEPPVSEALESGFEPDAWVVRGWPFGSPATHLRNRWEAFCHLVKHESRFLLRRSVVEDPDDPSELAPETMLHTLTKLIWDLDLVPLLPAGTAVYRARSAEEPSFTEPHEFSAPQAKDASQGRMNPAGVPMFYGALDPETAAVEVYRPDHPKVAVAEFYTVSDVSVVDLTEVPPVSPFDPRSDTKQLDYASFLHGFIREISKPIIHDDRVHREYVPTQILTEYLRYRLLPAEVGEIGGILYPSAVTGEKNLVLFIDQSGALHDDELHPDFGPRTGPQLLRCNTAHYTVYEYEPPRVQPGRRVPLQQLPQARTPHR